MVGLRGSPMVWFVWAAVLFGIGVRGGLVVRNASFWIDESMLALNVVHRPPAGLLEPLDLNQGAPVGYLLLCKGAQQLFGPHEWALRGVSLFAGLAALALFASFAFRALEPSVARTAVALFAVSPYLVGYSAEFKQYELDAAVCCALLMLGRSLLAGGTQRAAVGLALGGATAVWFSHPAALVLAGVGCSVLLEAALRNDRAALFTRVGIVAVWLLGFAACWCLFTRKLGMNAYLLDYWSGKFLPWPPRSIGDVTWVPHHLLELFDKPGGFTSAVFGGAGLAACAAGVAVVRLARTDKPLLVMLLVPIAAALAASAFHKYPFAGRLMLFAVPLLIPLVAVGLMTLCESLAPVHRRLPVLIVTLAFLPPTYECWNLRKQPLHAEDVREAVDHLAAHCGVDEPIYVHYGAVPGLAYYGPKAGLNPLGVTFSTAVRHGPASQFAEELEKYRGLPKVWIVLSHRQVVEEATIRATLDGWGVKRSEFRGADAVVWSYDLSRGDTNIPPTAAESPRRAGESRLPCAAVPASLDSLGPIRKPR